MSRQSRDRDHANQRRTKTSNFKTMRNKNFGNARGETGSPIYCVGPSCRSEKTFIPLLIMQPTAINNYFFPALPPPFMLQTRIQHFDHASATIHPQKPNPRANSQHSPLDHSTPNPPTPYCQTLFHKSSAGGALNGAEDAVFCDSLFAPTKAEVPMCILGEAGVSGAALFHPPKSSSAAIFGRPTDEAEAPKPEFDEAAKPERPTSGFGCKLPNPPPPGGDCIMLAKPPSPPLAALLMGELPHPKSVPATDDPAGDLSKLLCGVGAAVPIDAHGSLDPHASALERPEKVVWVEGAEDWVRAV